MAYQKNEKTTEKRPRRRGALGLIVASTVAVAPAIGCDDPKPANMAQMDGSTSDTAPTSDTAQMTDAADDVDDAYPSGLRG